MSGPIRFGDFQLDVSGYDLRCGGESVKLERIPMDLLILLATNPGKLVLRGEVVDRIWGENHYLKDETAINTAVKKLRAALADDAAKPRFIETITGKGYRFIAPVSTAPKSPDAKPETSRRQILVVLPFEDLSTPPHEHYLSDGVTEQLITSLGAAAPTRLGVVGRTSAMECQRRGLTVKEVGRELGADLLVEGSVRLHQQRVRINVRVLQARDQAQIWAKSYDLDLRDLLAWQSEAAGEILREATADAPADFMPHAAPARRLHPQAYECYLKGRRLWNNKTPRAYAEAVPLFQQAIDLDPMYALPYVGLADTWIMMGIHGLAPSGETYPRARAAAARALELDPALAEAHVALAEVRKGYDWDWPSAEAGYGEALRLNSNYAITHQWYGNLLSILERHDEAIAEVEEARRIDPLCPAITGFVGFTYFRARRYAEALGEAKQASDIHPHLPIVNWFLGQIHARLGNYDRAREALSIAVDESHGGALYLSMLGYICGRGGDAIAANEALTRLEGYSPERYVSPLDFSIASLGAGKMDRALEWLERAVDERVMRVTEMNLPMFDDLRACPRFTELAARVGLTANLSWDSKKC